MFAEKPVNFFKKRARSGTESRQLRHLASTHYFFPKFRVTITTYIQPHGLKKFDDMPINQKTRKELSDAYLVFCGRCALLRNGKRDVLPCLFEPAANEFAHKIRGIISRQPNAALPLGGIRVEKGDGTLDIILSCHGDLFAILELHCNFPSPWGNISEDSNLIAIGAYLLKLQGRG